MRQLNDADDVVMAAGPGDRMAWQEEARAEFRRIQKLNAALDRQNAKLRDALERIAAGSGQAEEVARDALGAAEEIKRTLNDLILPHVEGIKAGLRRGDERARLLVDLHQRHIFDPSNAEVAEQCEAALRGWLQQAA